MIAATADAGTPAKVAAVVVVAGTEEVVVVADGDVVHTWVPALTAASSFVLVIEPYTPSTGSPDAVWNALMADVVSGPLTPSIFPE